MNGAVKKFDASEELRVIPGWAYALGTILFVAMQLLWHVVVVRHGGRTGDIPPLAFRLFAGLFFGALLFVWSLLIGYVNRDSKRRGMNRALWTIIAVLVPNGIGFILYFLLRDPVQMLCPGCGTTISPAFTFCPKCRYELRPICANCGQAMSQGDVYCAHCGTEAGKGRVLDRS